MFIRTCSASISNAIQSIEAGEVDREFSLFTTTDCLDNELDPIELVKRHRRLSGLVTLLRTGTASFKAITKIDNTIAVPIIPVAWLPAD